MARIGLSSRTNVRDLRRFLLSVETRISPGVYPELGQRGRNDRDNVFDAPGTIGRPIFSLDQSIRPCEHVGRNREPDLLCYLQVDGKLELPRLLHGRNRRLGSLKNENTLLLASPTMFVRWVAAMFAALMIILGKDKRICTRSLRGRKISCL